MRFTGKFIRIIKNKITQKIVINTNNNLAYKRLRTKTFRKLAIAHFSKCSFQPISFLYSQYENFRNKRIAYHFCGEKIRKIFSIQFQNGEQHLSKV
jgi:hypothetical protein